MTQPLRYLSWIVTLPLAIFVILFAISNREPVALTLWPLPFEVEMPLFLPVLAAMVAGLIAGGVIAWWSGGRHRRRARQQTSRVKILTAELETLRAREAESSEAKTRRLEAERLEASARASENSALLEGSAPRRLTSVDA